MIAPGTKLGVYEILGPLATDGPRPLHAARLASGGPGEAPLFVVKPLETARDPRWARDEIAELLDQTSAFTGPGVVTVRGVFQVARDVCIVSDLLRGDSLRRLLAANARPSRMVAIAIARELARTLARIHRAGLVHGDVCPSTIMASGDGQLCLRELGIARVTSGRSAQHGEVRGHATYLAPERVAGRSVIGARADVYSLGLVLWELLTGQPAFRKRGDGARVSTAMTPDVPPPSTLVKCGREMDAIVMRALAVDPEARYASADELAGELDRHLISRAPGLDLKLELGTLMSRHLGGKLRAQQLLIERWTARRRDPSTSRDLPTASRDLPGPDGTTHVPLARAPSTRDLAGREGSTPPTSSTQLIVERARPRAASRPPAPPRLAAADLHASLFSEMDLAVQDLSDGDGIIIEAPVDEAPARPTPLKWTQVGPPPEVRTDDLGASVSSDLRPPDADSAATRGRLIGLALLVLALAAAVATFLLSPEGSSVLDYWLRALARR